ncbi:MAG: DUF3417 domain-containing protein, partial [Muribaculaceae bacterium]|nr:DUF3417 domain-containing protein [Muribaculaceae bacterium]
QDKLDAATIYSMLENEIIPLYFEKNSAGYSPRWIQYIKGSIGDIAPHFTMKRMIDDYIARFYDKEAARSKRLAADNFALAKNIVAWKEKVASEWDGIRIVDIRHSGEISSSLTGEPFRIEITVDTNGIGRDLGLEMVVYRQADGKENLARIDQFKVVKQEGNVLTYELSTKIKDAGVFRYGFRLYPKNVELPHRQDFAFTRWI